MTKLGVYLLVTLLFFLSTPTFAQEVSPATVYFPVLPFDAPPEAPPLLMPVAANQALDGVHKGVTRAVVIIHDETRDASGALAMLSTLAGSQNSSTIVLAPQFLLPSDIVHFAENMPEKGRGFAAWQVLSWAWGDDSMAISSRKSVSSFTAVDLLLMFLSDHDAFPDLRTIVVAGYGIGANFVQRYAAFSAAFDPVGKQNVELRFVIANATSYLYQTPLRPLGTKGFGIPDKGACAGVDDYPYGMEQINPYAKRIGANAAKVGYGTRFIMYLNGPAVKVPGETTCAALAQGKNSAERAENYRLYLRTIYGDVADLTQTFARIEGDRNDPAALFGSACGMTALFGGGSCPQAAGSVIR